MADGKRSLASVLDAGFQIVGAGAGAAAGLVTGNPALVIGGAMAGQAFASISTDVAMRVLSRREQQRVGAVIEFTVRAIQAEQAKGSTIREDEFFQGDRSNFAEVAEGVLLAAKSTFEEAKLPYLANLLAHIAIDDRISPTTANYLVMIAESLTWLETKLLAIVGRPEEFPMPEHEMHQSAADWEGYFVFRTFDTLHAEGRALIGMGRTKTDGIGLELFDLRMSAQKLTNEGRLTFYTMKLDQIPVDDLQADYERLIAPPAQPDGS